jgi:hypothetical protein
MSTITVMHRWTRKSILIIEAPTYVRALELAARQHMSLMDAELEGAMLQSAFLARVDLRGARLSSADMSGCYLREACLRGTEFCSARLTRAFLGGADLREADLRGADLSRADLRGARLVGADLRGTVLTGARLTGALCDWRWNAIPIELLRQYLGTSGGDSRLVIEMAFQDDHRPWSWLKLLTGPGARSDWVLGALADAIRQGDNAPDLLRCLIANAGREREGAAKADPTSDSYVGSSVRTDKIWKAGLGPHPHDASADSPSTGRMLWIRRRLPARGAAGIVAS